MWVLVTDLESCGRAANVKIHIGPLLRNLKVRGPLPPRAEAVTIPSWEALTGPLCLCMCGGFRKETGLWSAYGPR